MNYSTKKKFVNIFCYSDNKIKKTEAAAELKNWCKEHNITSFSAEKTMNVTDGQNIKIVFPGYVSVNLGYKEDEETFFGIGYSNEPIGELISKDIRSHEEGKFIVLCYGAKQPEGEVRIE